MSNVLPQEVRKRVWRMYYARFIIAAALIFLGLALLAGLALVPSYLTLQAGDTASAQESSAATSRQEDRDAIVHAQALLSTFSPLLSSTSTTALIARAISVRPAGMAIYHITTTVGHPGTIVIAGTAGSIKAISEYQNALRADTHFSGVSVPVGDLAGTGDGQFSITLSANF